MSLLGVVKIICLNCSLNSMLSFAFWKVLTKEMRSCSPHIFKNFHFTECEIFCLLQWEMHCDISCFNIIIQTVKHSCFSCTNCLLLIGANWEKGRIEGTCKCFIETVSNSNVKIRKSLSCKIKATKLCVCETVKQVFRNIIKVSHTSRISVCDLNSPYPVDLTQVHQPPGARFTSGVRTWLLMVIRVQNPIWRQVKEGEHQSEQAGLMRCTFRIKVSFTYQ